MRRNQSSSACNIARCVLRHARSKDYTGEVVRDYLKLPMHAGVDVPEGCWMRVGEEKRSWANGKALVLDTSFEHETMNTSRRDRVVLIIDYWHPGDARIAVSGVCAVSPSLHHTIIDRV